VREPAARQGRDGEWKTYEAISGPDIGECLLIAWPRSEALLDGSPPEATPATITSRVVRVAVRSEIGGAS
jgi:hypothetical protein